ncbi:MAG: 30S ribosomal protein S19e [Halobacteriota archaeon]
MTTVYDVTPEKLGKAVAEKLKENRAIHLPKWAMDVKTGVNKELPPHDSDWWYVRCASVLRQIYLNGPVGVSRLRTYYGGRHNRGVKKERFRKASGKVIRTVLLQLEQAGYVVKPEKGKKGRMISSKGQSFLDGAADEMIKKIKKGDENADMVKEE